MKDDYTRVHGGSRRRRRKMVEDRQEVGVAGLSALRPLGSKLPSIGSRAGTALAGVGGAITGAIADPIAGIVGGGSGQNGGQDGGQAGGSELNTTNAAILAGGMLGVGGIIYMMTQDDEQPTRFGPGPTPRQARQSRTRELAQIASGSNSGGN